MRRAFAILAATVTATVAATSACHHTAPLRHGAPSSRPARGAPMGEAGVSEVALAFPIAPGKTEAWQRALTDLLGPRYEEYEASRRRFGVASQTTFLQKTPMGDFALIHLTGPNVHKSLHAMSESKDPWDVEWRKLTLDLHGVDFARGAEVLPKVELAFSMSSGDLRGSQPFMFIAPLTRNGAFELRGVASELSGVRNAEYVAARAGIGVRREAVFLQSTAAGDVAVFYWLAADPKTSLRRFMESRTPLDEWLRSIARAVHPVALDALQTTVSRNTLVADYPRAR